MKKTILFPLLLVLVFAASAEAEALKSILLGEVAPQDRCQKPVKLHIYTDGRTEFASFSNDLFNRAFSGEVVESASPCFMQYDFQGKDKLGASLLVRTSIARVPKPGYVCPASLPLYNTTATLIEKNTKTIYQGNLNEIVKR